jgi:hypothetical protein
MVTAPHIRHQTAGVSCVRRMGLHGPLLALLGVLVVAELATAISISVGTNALQAASSSSAGDAALLRSTARLLGLQAAQPLLNGQDENDTVEPVAVLAARSVPTGHDITTGPRPAPTAARLRPLHGVPQSPRAPPLLT